jgi:hypothetical protein
MCFDGHTEWFPSVTLGSGTIVKSEHDVAGTTSFIRSKPVKSIAESEEESMQKFTVTIYSLALNC